MIGLVGELGPLIHSQKCTSLLQGIPGSLLNGKQVPGAPLSTGEASLVLELSRASNNFYQLCRLVLGNGSLSRHIEQPQSLISKLQSPRKERYFLNCLLCVQEKEPIFFLPGSPSGPWSPSKVGGWGQLVSCGSMRFLLSFCPNSSTVWTFLTVSSPNRCSGKRFVYKEGSTLF